MCGNAAQIPGGPRHRVDRRTAPGGEARSVGTFRLPFALHEPATSTRQRMVGKRHPASSSRGCLRSEIVVNAATCALDQTVSNGPFLGRSYTCLPKPPSIRRSPRGVDAGDASPPGHAPNRNSNGVPCCAMKFMLTRWADNDISIHIRALRSRVGRAGRYGVREIGPYVRLWRSTPSKQLYLIPSNIMTRVPL